MGSALGLAILSAVAITHTDSLVAAGTSHVVASDDGYHLALLVGAAMMAAAALIGLRIGNAREAAPLVMVSEETAPEPASQSHELQRPVRLCRYGGQVR